MKIIKKNNRFNLHLSVILALFFLNYIDVSAQIAGCMTLDNNHPCANSSGGMKTSCISLTVTNSDLPSDDCTDICITATNGCGGSNQPAALSFYDMSCNPTGNGDCISLSSLPTSFVICKNGAGGQISVSSSFLGCCEFNYTCGSSNLGSYSCGNLPPSDPTDPAYGITILEHCGTLSYSISDNQLVNYCAATDYTITRTITITDSDGATVIGNGTCTYTYTIQVETPPVIAGCPTDKDFACGVNASSDISNWLSASMISITANSSDDCGIVNIENNYTSPPATSCAGTGGSTVTFTVSDACGYTSVCSALIRIIDSAAPNIDTAADDQVVECDGAGNMTQLTAWLNSNGGASASDVCGSVSWSNNYSSLSDGCGATGSATVVFTASDDCGNTGQTSGTFTIVDSNPPSINTEADDKTVECDGSGNMAQLTAWLNANGGASSSDICGSVTWSNNFTALSDACGATGSANVTFTAEDDCGKTATTSATFTIEDTNPPSIDIEADDKTVECDGSGNMAQLTAWLNDNGGASSSDICGSVTWSNDFSALSDDCGATGSATVTFTAEDDCGKTASTTATFTIEDTSPPSIDTEADDKTVECDGSGNMAQLTAWLNDNGGASSSDICGSVTWSNDFSALSDDCGATGSATVTFNAEDDCGKTAISTATFTIEDTSPPSFDTEADDKTVECDGSGNMAQLTAWLNDNGGASSSDVCGSLTWSNNFTALSDGCGATGSATVTFTAKDDCGKTASTTATFSIEDTSPPSIDTEADDKTVECDGSGNMAQLTAWLNANGGASSSDACGSVTWSNNFTVLSDGCGATGSATVTFTAEDDCGKTATTTATFSIEDTSPPSIDTEADDETVECDGSGNMAQLNAWLNTNAGASSTDACGNVLWTNDFECLSDDCGETGSTTITFTATDECGLSATTVATFTIEDTSPPSIDTEADDETVECDGSGNIAQLTAWLNANAGASSTDACGNVIWTNDFECLSDDCGATGSTTITFTATDECGLSATTVATFTIEDTSPPNIIRPAMRMIVECDGTGNIPELEVWLETNAGAMASDICSEPITWSNNFTGLSDGCGATGSATVTFTATDACGSSATTTATFTIEDTTPPSMSAQIPDITLACGSDLPEPDYSSILAGDICSGVGLPGLNEYSNNASGCPGDPIIMTRKYYVADECGNGAEVVQKITFETAPDPIITCPDLPVAAVCLDSLDHSLEGLDILASCGIDYELSYELIKVVEVGGPLCDLTCYHYKYTITDQCGRTMSCTKIHVILTPPPSFTQEAEDIELQCNPYTGSKIADWLNSVSAESYCGDSEVVLSNNYDEDGFTGGCGDGRTGSQVVTFTATDECGRDSTSVATITIIDDVSPHLAQVAKDMTVNCSEDYPAKFSAWLNDQAGAIAIDHCSEINWTTEPEDPQTTISCNKEEAGTTVNFIVTDNCGNSAQTSATFTVMYDGPPVLLTEAKNIEIDCDTDVEAAISEWLEQRAGATAEGCKEISWRHEPTNISYETCGDATQVIFTATDDCGSMTTTTASLSVVDKVSPDLSAIPESLTFPCSDEIEAEIYENIQELISSIEDNCTSVSIISATEEFIINERACGNTGSGFFDYTVSDECGNISEGSILVTLIDETPPVFGDIPNNIDEEITATDECAGVTINFIDEDLNSGNCSFIRTWTATDECGNTATVSHTFAGQVGEAPRFEYEESDLTVSCYEDINPNVVQVNAANGLADMQIEEISNDGLCKEPYSSVIYRFTAIDNCSNRSTEDVIFKVLADLEAPVFVSFPTDLTFKCSEGIVWPEPIVTDNCSNLTITQNTWLNDGAVEENCNNGFGYDLFREWIATDACGNSSKVYSEAWAITDDYVGPKFEFVPESKTIDCKEEVAFGEAICTSQCGEVSLTFEDEVNMGGCESSTQYIRIWTGVDACGNVAIAEQVINLPPDTEAPIFTYVEDDKLINCGEEINFGTPTCEDNCSNIDHLNVEFVDTDLEEGCGMIRVWTVTDLCGNIATAEQIIRIDDSSAPLFEGIELITLQCGENSSFIEPSITETCGSFDLSFKDQVVDQDCFGNNINERTWTATDDCGNASSFVQLIKFEDDVAPSLFGIEATKTISCEEEMEFDQIEVSDNCSADVELIFEDKELTTLSCENCHRIFERTWTATDVCGNLSSFVQTIFVEDLIAPIFESFVQEQILNCNEELAFVLPIVNDNCSVANLDYLDEFIQGDCASGKQIERTWIATDDAGNRTTLVQLLTVTDNESPMILTQLEDKIVSCFLDLNFDQIEVIDNCGEVVITSEVQNQGTIDCPDGMVQIKTWTVKDACGNEATTEQRITVKDEEPPIVSEIQSFREIKCNESFEFDRPTVIDNCMVYEINFVDTEIEHSCRSLRTVRRDWIAEDACGNQTTTSQTISIIDFDSPKLQVVLNDQILSCNATPIFDTPEATDDCSEVSVAFEDSQQNTSCNQDVIYTRTWTFTDDCGNAFTTLQNILVEADKEAPSFDPLAEVIEITCNDSFEFDIPNITDNCSLKDTWFEEVELDAECEGLRTVQRTWFAEDACGNISNVSQQIALVDKEPPLITNTPANITIDCGSEIEFGFLSAEDDCSEVSIDFKDSETSNACDQNTTYTRLWTVSDACGNVATYEQSIETLADIEAPVLQTVLTNHVIDCTEFLDFDLAIFEDNCNIFDLSFIDTENTSACETIKTRTWTAIDACDNETIVQQVITMIDEQAPIIEQIENLYMTYEEYQHHEEPIVNIIDNCSSPYLGDLTVNGEGNCEEYYYVHNYEVLDECGLINTMSYNVYITDREADIEILPYDELINCGDELSLELLHLSSSINGVNWSIENDENNSWEILYSDNLGAKIKTGSSSITLKIQATSHFGCETETTLNLHCRREVISSIKEKLLLEDIHLFPNPTDDELLLKFNQSESADFELAIVDVLGREIENRQFEAVRGENKVFFNVSGLQSGTYFLRIQSGLRTKALKFIKN